MGVELSESTGLLPRHAGRQLGPELGSIDSFGSATPCVNCLRFLSTAAFRMWVVPDHTDFQLRTATKEGASFHHTVSLGPSHTDESSWDCSSLAQSSSDRSLTSSFCRRLEEKNSLCTEGEDSHFQERKWKISLDFTRSKCIWVLTASKITRNDYF